MRSLTTVALTALLLQLPVSFAEETESQQDDSDPAPVAVLPDEDMESAADASASGDDRFLPTDRIRYDQEVDFPTDI